MFAHRASEGRIEVAFTDRHGGASSGPWESLNLGTSNGDDPELVGRNIDAVLAAFGADRHVRMSQMHSVDVLVVDAVPDRVPVADALVTTTPGLALLTRAADCLPLVLADPEASVAGVVHAGREGMAAGIVAHTVAVLRELGADRLRAWLGPRACGGCYEVPEEMAERVAAAVPAARATTRHGTPALDIGAGVRAQLAELGVAVDDIGRDLCTIESDDLFSYRRQGQESGRLGALVRIRP